MAVAASMDLRLCYNVSRKEQGTAVTRVVEKVAVAAAVWIRGARRGREEVLVGMVTTNLLRGRVVRALVSRWRRRLLLPHGAGVASVLPSFPVALIVIAVILITFERKVKVVVPSKREGFRLRRQGRQPVFRRRVRRRGSMIMSAAGVVVLTMRCLLWWLKRVEEDPCRLRCSFRTTKNAEAAAAGGVVVGQATNIATIAPRREDLLTAVLVAVLARQQGEKKALTAATAAEYRRKEPKGL